MHYVVFGGIYYFYCMMSYLLPEDCFYLMPKKITKPMLEIRAEREDRKSKEAEPEPEQTAEEKQAVEDLVNKWISADMPVLHEEMSLSAATERGAMALFGEKYGDTVRVITAGDVSCELCGGTHIHHTGEIMKAKINKEKSISSGIRRITMSVGPLAE